MKSNIEQLRNRGYVEDSELKRYERFSKEDLLELLISDVPISRTVAAKLLGNYKDEESMSSLISALLIEKKLYSKIAISESLCLFGKQASSELIKHLGKVGNNQHRDLPEKPFDKKSYPLPRDIVARTLSNIGVEALNDLKLCLSNGERREILEAIDAVGFISFYNDNDECFEIINELIELYKKDNLVTWKLLRCLQSFNNNRTIDILKFYSSSSIKQLSWEAERSLNQVKRKISE